MHTPLISIIIPVYKVEPYLRRCLDSVVNQTYANLEIILIDDGSPDNCPKICDEYAEKDERIVVIHKDNGGLSDARNVGTKIAKGDFIYYLDSDDELPSNAIELLEAEVEKHPEIDIVMGFMYDNKHDEYYNIDCYKNHQYVTDRKWIQYNTFCHGKNIPVNGCNKLLRRNFIEKNNLFFKKGLIHEDNHWMFFVVKFAENIAFVFEPTYIRYWNKESITSSSSQELEAKSWIKIILDYSEKFYAPFHKLQLARYMDMYFGKQMYQYNLPDSKSIHKNFLKNCLRNHFWIGTILLSLWRISFSIKSNIYINALLACYSKKLFLKESLNYQREYGFNHHSDI